MKNVKYGSSKLNTALNLGTSPLCDDLIKFNSNRKVSCIKLRFIHAQIVLLPFKNTM